MKSYKANAQRLMSYEHLKGCTKLEKTQKLSKSKKIISIRSITPEGILTKKGDRKHQSSFSYIPKTKTPSVQPKAKLTDKFKYCNSGKQNISSDRIAKKTTVLSREKKDSKSYCQSKVVGTKFSSRNSKQNTNTDTLWSIRSYRSKKGSNVNSTTSDKDNNYYEKWRIVKTETKR